MNDFSIKNELINKLVKEGKRVGKVPWCCYGVVEGIVSNRLNEDSWKTGIVYLPETMEETISRRKKE